MSLIIRQKKGALQLSINAIVVLILAITMLGLGLGFMRNMFGQTTGQFDEIASDMKNQVVEEIQASGDRLILNKYDITMKKSETKELYFGIKNVEGISKDADPIAITCGVGMGGGAATSVTPSTFSKWTIPGSEVAVLKMSLKAGSSAVPDTYPCKLTTTINAEDLAKDFFVTIK